LEEELGIGTIKKAKKKDQGTKNNKNKKKINKNVKIVE